MIDSKIRIILHIFTGAVLIVSAACGALFLSKTTFSWKVGFGYSIYDESQNTGYFINVSVLLWVCVSILFAIFAILSIAFAIFKCIITLNKGENDTQDLCSFFTNASSLFPDPQYKSDLSLLQLCLNYSV